MDLLSWLPAHGDLAAAINAARRESDGSLRLARAVELSGYRRDFSLTARIDRLAIEAEAAAQGAERSQSTPALMPMRIALLSSHTVDHLLPGIRVAGLHRRLALSLYVAPYGTYRQCLLGGDPELEAFAPKLVVLALDAQDQPIRLPLHATEATVADAVESRVEELRQLWRKARQRFAATVVQQTFIAPDLPLFGSYEALVPAAPLAILDRLNAAIRSAAREEGVLLLDLAGYAARGSYGEGLGDPVRWHQAKQLVSPTLSPLYGDLVARIAAAVAGLSRKCLVLDLDNTLWGGVIGDDGLNNLRLGQGSPTGEAYLAFQHYVAMLAQRGIILAVCSKNDPAVAEAGFGHPEMFIKRDQVAAFMANWEDKATNLRRIAGMLDIGLDSLVFVDDNPAERDIVRRELPGVAVPELPEDIAEYPARLAAAGYFEAASFTSDDLARGRSYALNAERKALLSQTTDIASYLRSLEMRMAARAVQESDLARVTQLINKTNQFNLTTRRYTEAQVEELARDPRSVALALRLRDKFGDNGLISVLLARPDRRCAPDELWIDTWLMSCRVLGRQVEQAALCVLAAAARARGVRALVGEYLPSGRNTMVQEHYPRLGFAPHPVPDGGDGAATHWRLDLLTAKLPSHFITIEDL